MSDIGVYMGGIDVNVGVYRTADRPQVSAHEGGVSVLVDDAMRQRQSGISMFMCRVSILVLVDAALRLEKKSSEINHLILFQ